MAPRSEPREDAVAGYRLADLAWTGRPALNHSVWIGRSIVMAAGGGTLMCLSSLGRVSLVIGETIDRYHVVEKLGQGGMGVVYKARDTLLGRFVALKALPPDAVADPQRRQRFLEEAKAASALQHPGIVSVYDVVEAAGQVFIVMEHVAGETLEQRMGQQALPLSRALRYGEQIADALARAHAAGIVHRDLKPSNIMVAEDDTAKVLDFGLAKLAEAPFAGDEAPTVSRGHVERLTREGAVVGTLAYMSPEQAAGKPVDARTDVFSFGVLLYEMLTGRHPFRRGSQLETLSAIREANPEPPTSMAPGLPPEAERAILRCLHKEPSRRWQSMADLSAVLRDLREDSESGRGKGVAAPTASPSRARWWVVGTVVLVLAALAAVGLFRRFGGSETPGPLELTRLTVDTGYTGDPTISADGKLVAYASDRSGRGDFDIWVQHVGARDAARLTHDPADDWQPSLSPDGSRVVYRSESGLGALYVVSTLGGPPKKLAERGRLPRFSPDGSQVSFLRDVGYSRGGLLPMFLVSAEGGTPRPFQPDFGVPDLPGSAGPIWSPDGRHILFSGGSLKAPASADWWVAPVAGGPAVATGAAAVVRSGGVLIPCAWVGSHLLFTMGNTVEGVNLYRVRIGADFRVTGPPEPLTSGLGITHLASVSADGHVVLPRWSGLAQIWSLDPERLGDAATPEQLTHDAATKYMFGLDRAGDRLAYTALVGSAEQYGLELRVRDLATGEESATRLTSPAVWQSPRLSPDGAFLAWSALDAGKFVARMTRTGEAGGEEICRDCALLGFPSEKQVLLSAGPRIFLRSVSDGTETPLFTVESGQLLNADLSWDGRWLATLVGRPDGKWVIDVVPVGEGAPGGARAVEIRCSDDWLTSPRWSPDGDRLYYMAVHDGFFCIFVQALDHASKKPRGEPFAVFHAHRNPWRMMAPRGIYGVAVSRRRLVFGGVEMTGNILMAKLPPE
jgi:Tol biopolymer transport system component/predicted Ser/Thr protein kinase